MPQFVCGCEDGKYSIWIKGARLRTPCFKHFSKMRFYAYVVYVYLQSLGKISVGRSVTAQGYVAPTIVLRP